MLKWMPAVLIAMAYGFSALVYPFLPDEVPIHWSLSGEPDRWVPRIWGSLALPTVMLVNWGLFVVFPAIDPRRNNISKFQGTYDLIVILGIGLLLLLHVLALGAALGWAVSVPRMVSIGVGVLLAILGNILPHARPNWTFGIRTPWTLDNGRAWQRTHRLGGALLLLAGLISIGAGVGFPDHALLVMLTAVVCAALMSVIFSYFAWKQEIHGQQS